MTVRLDTTLNTLDLGGFDVTTTTDLDGKLSLSGGVMVGPLTISNGNQLACTNGANDIFQVTPWTHIAGANVYLGEAALPVGSTSGFPVITKMSGPPTGAPTVVFFAPMVIEDDGVSVYKLWVYTSAGWKSATLV